MSRHIPTASSCSQGVHTHTGSIQYTHIGSTYSHRKYTIYSHRKYVLTQEICAHTGSTYAYSYGFRTYIRISYVCIYTGLYTLTQKLYALTQEVCTAQNTCSEVQYIVGKPTYLLSECQCSVEDTWSSQLGLIPAHNWISQLRRLTGQDLSCQVGWLKKIL